MKNIFSYQTVIGRISIVEENNHITNIFFENDTLPLEAGNSKEYPVKESETIKEAGCQLNEYLEGRLQVFNLPLKPEGTEFMQNVWKSLQDIPYGSTKSYKDIAKAVGSEKACRAVGLANNRNPIPIFIPCHRVIGTNGKLVGYRGGLETKLKLLEMERRHGSI